jgi:lipopolysaccharide export system permease protein
MLILPRYLMGRVVAQVAGVTAVLFLVVVVLQFTRVLARAVADRFPTEILFSLVAWGAAQNISVVLPIASFIGIVLGLGRLYENHEMAAMAACGVGGWRMSWPVVLVVLVIATVLAWLVLVYNPRAAAEQDALKVRALQIGSYSDLRAGEFRSFDSGALVLYAGQVSESGELASIFAQRLADKEEVVIVARRGRIERNMDRLPLVLVLNEGTYYSLGALGLKQRYVGFDELRVPIRLPVATRDQARVDSIPTLALVRSSRLAEIAELHGRLALPLMALILGMVAIPMSRLRPRQGRYGRAALAIFIYFLYANLLTAGGTWLSGGRTPHWAGLWWVHLLAIAIAILAFSRERWIPARLLK